MCRQVNLDLLLSVLIEYADLEAKEKRQTSKSYLRHMGSTVQKEVPAAPRSVQMVGGLKIEQVA
jgi:hypothetical protein